MVGLQKPDTLMTRQPITEVRILPMSDKIDGFRGRTIEQVQQDCFLKYLRKTNGRFHYLAAGLKASQGAMVLFQFKAKIIAAAIFVRNEKFNSPTDAHAGVLHFEPESIHVFDPIDADAMRKAWPGFRAFGHVKQSLNPLGYPAFKRRLGNVQYVASAGRRK